jgi:NADH-quinone oxidoreductase subunit M
MLGVVLSGNLIVFYLFWETMIIPAYLIIVYFGESRNSSDIGLKFFIFMQIGALMVLFSFVNIYLIEGTFDMRMISGSFLPPWIPVILFIGFAIKMGIFPFHSWLPDAHAESPAPLSALLSGVMTGLGAYGILRILIITLHVEFHPFVAVLALISMLYGGVMALTQRDIKRILAYSTVSQMGYILLGLTSGVGGIAGGSLHIVGHGFAKASLFLAAGAIIHATGERNISKFGGLIRSEKFLAAAVIVSALALCGLPPMIPYVSEVLIFEPALSADMGMASMGIIAGIVTIVYFAVFIDRTVFGKAKKMTFSAYLKYPVYLLALLNIILGIFPDMILRLLTTMG